MRSAIPRGWWLAVEQRGMVRLRLAREMVGSLNAIAA
jgi:hypothetical protein